MCIILSIEELNYEKYGESFVVCIGDVKRNASREVNKRRKKAIEIFQTVSNN